MADEKKKSEQESRTNSEVRQFVVFQLGREEYGIPILQVRSIEKLVPISNVPRMPGFLKGVVNLRGELIPVIDLRERFGVKPLDQAENRIIISKPVDDQVFGMMVDSVSEIEKIPASEIESMPPAIVQIDKEHLSGAAKVGERFIILLDLKSILSNVEKTVLVSLKDKAKETQ